MKKRRTIRKRAGKDQLKQEMLRILLRGRGETLGDACKEIGITPTTYYYRIRNATFGSRKRGRQRSLALTSVEVKRLATLIRRQERLQRDLVSFRHAVLGQ